MHKIFGLPVAKCSDRWTKLAVALQKLGSVDTRQGQFLAWSNTLRHKPRPFSLKDTTRPDHERYITL
jgi:hypothetical protein